MTCVRCGRESHSASHVCPFCGAYMGSQEAVHAAPEAPVLYDDAVRAREPMPRAAREERRAHKARRSRRRRAGVKKPAQKRYPARMVNWAMVSLVALIVFVAAAAGGFVYLKLTPAGQLALARLGRDANADAFWALGTEYLDQGFIARAIETYEKALDKEPEREDLADKLFLLAEAYEAGSLPAEAEAVYTRVYTQLDPASVPAYSSAIRLMLAQDRQFEATTLMQTAYEETGDETFANQRAALVPLPPEADLSGGRYMFSRTFEFISPQGYEIYYAKGDAPLPEEGTLYREPIRMEEGTHEFRAVCVSSQLISDEMSVKYVITLPTPLAPKSTLAPGEYETRQKVSLRNVDEDRDLVFYYTIDGSAPTLDSPRYEGVPIVLGVGRVTLRAISVNRYGKISNELSVQYRINVRFTEKYFRFEDQFKDFTLLKTTYEEFTARFGEPLEMSGIQDDAVQGVCAEARWVWGEARFFTGNEGRLLYHVSTRDPAMTGPQGTKVGMDMDEVTRRFRDMNQLPNDRGDRGIYYDINEGYAGYEVLSDDPLEGTLRYVNTTSGAAPNTTILSYGIKGGRVESVSLSYYARRISNVR